ncbi:glucose-1-phosphate thymidylyltransferase [Micromonospora sp. PTRAS2]
MRALVLAGGMGTRLRPLTHAMPKQLVPVAGRPILHHCLETIRELGVVEVGIIVGDWAREIEEALGDGSALGLELTYITQEAPFGLAHCVFIARDFLGDEDFVMVLGDNVVVGDLQAPAAEFRQRRPAAQLVATRVSNPAEYGVVATDSRGRAVQLQEKPADPCSDLALMGIYFFSPAVHNAVRQISPSARNEWEITDAISWLVAEGREVGVSVFTGHWKDTGRVDDLLECNDLLLRGLGTSISGSVDAASTIEGPVVIGPGAVVTDSYLRGPLIIGASSRITRSSIGPGTSLGQRCDLGDCSISGSIVLDDVSIQSVRGIRDSVIGRSAQVTLAQPAQGTHRMVLGDHTTVEVTA